jgi:ATP-dependent helicase HrpA
LPRFLKALQIRVERAYASLDKDRQKAEQIKLYSNRYEEMKRELEEIGFAGVAGCGRVHEEGRRLLLELRWAIEEFKISVFAPEIKTRTRVSAKRLEEKLWKWEAWKSEKM